MKIKKEYIYSGVGKIWRLLPTDSDKLVIEERNVETKEAFFNCIEIKSGKRIFQNFQLEEKFWVGIETIYKDIIFFNKYLKPDMPQHNGLAAFDINKQQILWENSDCSFLFIKDAEVFCYKQKFEGREYFGFNYLTGQISKEFGEDPGKINAIKKETITTADYTGYLFPQHFNSSDIDLAVNKLLNELKEHNVTVGQLEYIHFENIILTNTFEPNDKGTLNNIFRAIDIKQGKVIFEEVLNNNSNAAVPDSFFIKDSYIFLLKGKNELVCSVKK